MSFKLYWEFKLRYLVFSLLGFYIGFGLVRHSKVSFKSLLPSKEKVYQMSEQASQTFYEMSLKCLDGEEGEIQETPFFSQLAGFNPPISRNISSIRKKSATDRQATKSFEE